MVSGIEGLTLHTNDCWVQGREKAHDPMVLEWCFRAPCDDYQQDDEEPSERGASEDDGDEVPSKRGASEHDSVAEDEYNENIDFGDNGSPASEYSEEDYEDERDAAMEKKKEDKESDYVHKGIANRSFKKVWHLEDHTEVIGAKLSNGLLCITLEKIIPEELKAKKIKINQKQERRSSKELLQEGKA
mgnify:CR=1 FL=1